MFSLHGAGFLVLAPVLSSAAGVAQGVGSTPILEKGRLTASDGSEYHRLGVDVAVSGDTVVVGGGSGTVYVFERPETGWTSATEVARLTAAGGAPFNFGVDVAISGDVIVVGSPESGALEAGAVYLYVRPADGWADMTETAVLTASNGAFEDHLGTGVAIDGDTVVAGASLADPNGFDGAGRVYVFERPSSGWASATETAVLTAAVPRVGDLLGREVAVRGDTVAAAAPSFPLLPQAGEIHVFRRPRSGWVTGTPEIAVLTASDGSPGDLLGSALDIEGSVIAAGAAAADGAFLGQGAVYVFVEPAGGWIDAEETARFSASDPAGYYQLGVSIALHDGAILAGAPGFILGGGGAVYRFVESPTGWVSGTEESAFTTTELQAGEQFGCAIAVSDSTVVVGATHANVGTQVDQGEAWVFEPPQQVLESGCGGMDLVVSGSTRVGQSIRIAMSVEASAAPWIIDGILVGAPLDKPVEIAGSLACRDASPCVRSCRPIAWLPGSAGIVSIPNDPGLVGLTPCAEGLTIDAAAPCVRITRMVLATVSR